MAQQSSSDGQRLGESSSIFRSGHGRGSLWYRGTKGQVFLDVRVLDQHNEAMGLEEDVPQQYPCGGIFHRALGWFRRARELVRRNNRT